MKRNAIFPLLIVLVIFLLLGSACGLIGNKEDEPQEPQVIIITATPGAVEPPAATAPPPVATQPPVVATEPPAVVVTEAPAVAATEPPSDSGSPSEDGSYFKDEFDDGLDNYDRFIFKVDDYRIYRNNEELEKKSGFKLEDGTIQFNIKDYWLYYYLIYQPQEYDDVKVSVEVENLGYSASIASLVCRYDEDRGWYQVMIDASGRWVLYYYDAMNKKFNRLTNGGAEVFNYGKDTNKYTFVCQGKELSFYINDVLSQTYEHKDLKRGKVGFAIQSPDTYTIMNVPWFEVNQP